MRYIFARPDLDTLRDNPRAVINAIDDYCRTQAYLMNVGPDKGKIVTDLIAKVKPDTMIECGGYCGYSCLLFASALRDAGGKRYFSLERNPEFGAFIMALVDLAGLRDIVRVVIGPSEEGIWRLHATGQVKKIDLLFLDHYKPAYKTDLKLAEHLGLITVGSVVAADNVINPGNPPYLKYVQSSVEERRQEAKEWSAEKGYDMEGLLERSKTQYKNRIAVEKPKHDYPGNPNLVFETTLNHSFEPSGKGVSCFFLVLNRSRG